MNIEFRDLLIVALPFLGSAIGWYTRSTLIRAKASGTELDNTAKAIKIWRDLANELYDQVKSLSSQTTWLEEEVRALLAENEKQKIVIASQTEKISYLEATLAKLNQLT